MSTRPDFAAQSKSPSTSTCAATSNTSSKANLARWSRRPRQTADIEASQWSWNRSVIQSPRPKIRISFAAGCVKAKLR